MVECLVCQEVVGSNPASPAKFMTPNLIGQLIAAIQSVLIVAILAISIVKIVNKFKK